MNETSIVELDNDMVVVTTTHEPPQIHAFGQANAWHIEDGILTVTSSSGKQMGSWASGFWASVRFDALHAFALPKSSSTGA